jgi:putative oxidoreductase
MDVGRVLLRLTIGGTFFVHGTQKLFGWFGGYGPDGTGQFFESLGLRPGRRNAIAAGATETGSGILVALGLGTPLAAAGLSAVMITALRTAIWSEGFKPATGEHEVLLAVGALALTETGPGSPSLGSGEGSGGRWRRSPPERPARRRRSRWGDRSPRRPRQRPRPRSRRQPSHPRRPRRPPLSFLDLEPRLLEVELALNPAHHVGADLAGVAKADQLPALGGVDLVHHPLVGE